MAFLDSQGVSKLCALLKDKFDSLWTAVNRKQDALTAGANITINNGVISAADTDTTYTAGTGINIDSNNEISCTVSGGASYTAGNGINIDNNVISQTPSTIPLIGMLQAITSNNTNIYNVNNWVTTFVGDTNITNAANREKHIQNLKTLGMTYFTQGFNGDGNGTYLKQIITAVGGDDTTTNLPIVAAASNMDRQYIISMGNVSFDYGYMTMLGYYNVPVLIIFDGSKSKGSNNRWYFIKNPEKVFQNKYFNSVAGLTSHSIPQAIDEVATNLNTRVPTVPTTDGDYVLKTSIASGTPTYSWEADSGSSGGGDNYSVPYNIFTLIKNNAVAGQMHWKNSFGNNISANDVPEATSSEIYNQIKAQGFAFVKSSTTNNNIDISDIIDEFDLTYITGYSVANGVGQNGNTESMDYISLSEGIYLILLDNKTFLYFKTPDALTTFITWPSSSSSSLPSTPSNDGTYLLKCVVSSGTPTYSWESVTVGGSY